MPYIKKLVLHGFKSFPRRTEIPLDKSLNVIVGPNGSGKSNLTDAICFVLGRLSIKSMRAAKAANLIFAGTKAHKPASEASVEMVIDNSDKTFSVSESQVSIKRIVRKNGQSIYKINGQTKTRQEVLELLAQAGVDPHGFNIVLQGEIDSFVKMHPDERRKIIEEVAGISVYETRKHKSLRELEKTDEKLKEVNAVLKERTTYLKNLEEERKQALRYKKLQKTQKRCKASLLKKKLDEKIKDRDKIAEEINKKNKQADKIKIEIGKINEEIQKRNNRIDEINKQIQKAAGAEQDTLRSEIAELKAENAGLNVKKENYENQTQEITKRKQELEKSIQTQEQEIKELRKSKGKSRKQDLDKKQQQLEQMEEKIKKYYSYKSSLNHINERLHDKEKNIQRIENESESVLKRLEEIESSLKFKQNLKENKELLDSLKNKLQESKEVQKQKDKIILDMEKKIATCFFTSSNSLIWF
jgi:chromosome segregation protein